MNNTTLGWDVECTPHDYVVGPWWTNGVERWSPSRQCIRERPPFPQYLEIGTFPSRLASSRRWPSMPKSHAPLDLECSPMLWWMVPMVSQVRHHILKHRFLLRHRAGGAYLLFTFCHLHHDDDGKGNWGQCGRLMALASTRLVVLEVEDEKIKRWRLHGDDKGLPVVHLYQDPNEMGLDGTSL